ncbi:MAG: methyltransferase domain-containing protein [Bacteroidales bacterium]|nr:methyltransferase domain-containing protein [Bacteroidales bacterium]
MERDREKARQRAKNHFETNSPLNWFEALYQDANDNYEKVPWADLAPNPNMLEWFKNHSPKKGKTCLVIGCGYGDDAEFLTELGYKVDAFDISKTAIEQCNKRFPDTKTHYFAANLLEISEEKKYDFIFESYTLQAIPGDLRQKAYVKIPGLLAPQGELLIICRARSTEEEPGQLPWPLTKEELSVFDEKLECVEFQDFLDKNDSPPARRFMVLYRKR